MSTLHGSKKTSPQDWHPADIVAALRKAGWSLRRLSIEVGLSPFTLKAALNRPYPNGERVIASAIGVQPQAIWPSRYDRNGLPNRGRKLKPVPPRIARPAPANNTHGAGQP